MLGEGYRNTSDDKRLEGDRTGAGMGGGGPGKQVSVVAVENHTGEEEMRDLTVADIHTYYVIAGDEPVLVHNNNSPIPGACPRPPTVPGKTAGHADNISTLSGWASGYPAGYTRVPPATMLAHTQQIGAPITPAGFRDHGIDGQYYASHAERQAALVRPNQPVEVDRDMCDDCIEWFKHEAVHQGQVQRVTDPSGVNVFHPDGTWSQE